MSDMNDRKNGADERFEFYSLDDLAKRWGTSYRNLHRKAREGKLRVIRLGVLIRVPRKEVERVEAHGF
jgi:excisionase family DNA binding protein